VNRWSPREGDWLPKPRPVVGALLAYEYRAWRVRSVADLPEQQWSDHDRDRALRRGSFPPPVPYVVVLRPATTDQTFTAHDDDVHLRVNGGYWGWRQLPEHYSVCVCCGDVPPCWEIHAEQIGKAVMARLSRFEVAGICPAFGEPITARQRSITWQDNVELLGGPPVTFHSGRRWCLHAASRYEQKWVAETPRVPVGARCPAEGTSPTTTTAPTPAPSSQPAPARLPCTSPTGSAAAPTAMPAASSVAIRHQPRHCSAGLRRTTATLMRMARYDPDERRPRLVELR